MSRAIFQIACRNPRIGEKKIGHPSLVHTLASRAIVYNLSRTRDLRICFRARRADWLARLDLPLSI